MFQPAPNRRSSSNSTSAPRSRLASLVRPAWSLPRFVGEAGRFHFLSALRQEFLQRLPIIHLPSRSQVFGLALGEPAMVKDLLSSFCFWFPFTFFHPLAPKYCPSNHFHISFFDLFVFYLLSGYPVCYLLL